MHLITEIISFPGTLYYNNIIIIIVVGGERAFYVTDSRSYTSHQTAPKVVSACKTRERVGTYIHIYYIYVHKLLVKHHRSA